MVFETFTKTITERPRRNRKSEALRSLVQETRLHPSQLIAPLFVIDGTGTRQAIESLPGIFREPIDVLLRHISSLYLAGIKGFALFPVIQPDLKDPEGSEALNPDNLIFRAIRAIKREIPEICLIADVALDPFTSHGHDGLVKDGLILNDETLNVLDEMACLLADSGADVVAPSHMMDGRVKSIREALDKNGFTYTNILSYTAKFASALYGPFREAVGSSLQFGDKKTYQINPANRKEAVREALIDESQGADFLLIKPALPFLDIIAEVKSTCKIPIGAYQVSGEYAMIMAAGKLGWLKAEDVLVESLISIKRAGADFILTYGAEIALKALSQ